MLNSKTILSAVLTLALISAITTVSAQEVSIPDPGLNAAIRDALAKPSGPLTEADLLGLTFLSAGGRSINTVEGLEGARHLGILDLDNNSITNFPTADALTNLTILDLFNNHLTSFVLSNTLPKLNILDVALNSLAECSLPTGLTNLDTLLLEGNALTHFTLPAGLTRLTQLDLSGNQLTRFTLPAGTTNLLSLLLNGNQLTNVVLPADLNRLNNLDLDFNLLENFDLPAGLIRLENLTLLANQLTGLTIPADMTNLSFLDIEANQLLSFTLPAGLTELKSLRLGANKLGSFILPPGLTNLISLAIAENQLTNLSLPSDLINVSQLDLGENPLANFTFPAGLINLSDVDLGLCRLTNLTLPPDMTNLNSIFLDGNPLTTLVLPETLAASNLAATVTHLQNQGVQVFTYPLTVQLTFPQQQPIGAFRFGITGPPGVYSVSSSSNLTDWTVVNFVNNPLGGIFFTDTTAHLSPQMFYRAALQTPPANMVFIPANTFTMGSPTNELHRMDNEGPQTKVTLTHGFWIGKYEVTQGEYLDVTGMNPSFFPGDLSRPVETVSWPDATNYCAKLTQRELAAGHIPPGSRYRLPTEAEWECAARAGTTTRFSYGDDLDYSSLTNHAWYLVDFSDLATHPVGQKLPNPWGLHDMTGNVWEWTQDWLGDLPGGEVVDPTGPPSNPIGWKVVRGGAYDFGASDCRSARRFFFGSHPALNDSDIGFRVVLVFGDQ